LASTSIVGGGGNVSTFTPAGEAAFDAAATAGEGAGSLAEGLSTLQSIAGGGGAPAAPAAVNQISSKIGGDDNEELLAMLAQLLQQRGG
jgi:hypothetical protein